MWLLLFEQNMNGHLHCMWMYNRLLPDRSGYTQEFLDGVNEFDQFARTQTEFLNGESIDVLVRNTEIGCT